MAHEHLKSSSEHSTTEISKEAAQRSKELAQSTEFSLTEHTERVAEARKDAIEAAKEAREHRDTAENQPPDELKPPISIKKREQSFKQTLTQIQNEMPNSSRTFSKIIHQPFIEKTSEVVGNTIARPDSILTGSLCAFLAVLSLYLIARYNGFSLSGFETIGAFIIGWIIGLLIDLVKSILRR